MTKSHDQEISYLYSAEPPGERTSWSSFDSERGAA
jgi:hypothetical protein